MVDSGCRSVKQSVPLIVSLEILSKPCKAHILPGSKLFIVITLSSIDFRSNVFLCAYYAGSVVVHLFLEEERKYYNLEGLWGKSDNIAWIESKSTVETLDTITVAGK